MFRGPLGFDFVLPGPVMQQHVHNANILILIFDEIYLCCCFHSYLPVQALHGQIRVKLMIFWDQNNVI